MQRADAQGGGETLRNALGRCACGDRQRVRQRNGAVVADAGEDRNEWIIAAFEPVGEGLRQCRGTLAVAARLGEQEALGLHRVEGGGRVGPARLDDREGTRRAQRLDQIRRRALGNDDEWTLQRHGGVPNSRGSHAPCQSAVNGASTRRAFVLLPSLRARGIAVAAVAEGGDNERIDANGAEGSLHQVAIGGVADQALADEGVGQRRKGGIAVDEAGDLLEVVEGNR